MKQTVHGTENLCVYDDFRQEAIKPRRTERAQRQEIEKSLDLLTQQADYWSLDVIRKAAAALAADNEGSESLYFLLNKVISAKPGEWVISRKA